MPRVTIGVPVYNGVSLIRECLENLAKQSYSDFEVIVSDNASDDGTSDICEEFASSDARFHHIKQKTTVPVLENFRFLLQHSESPYFLWRAYDDLANHDYLSTLVNLLDEEPGTRLAVGRVLQTCVGKDDERVLEYPIDDKKMPLDNRLRALMFKGHASWLYGIWRREACEEATARILADYPDPWGGDHLTVLHAIVNDGLRGSKATQFIQRLQPAPPHYVNLGSGKKESYEIMVDRNRRFGEMAAALIAESNLPTASKGKLEALLPKYVLARCHGRKRLFQAKMRQLRGR